LEPVKHKPRIVLPGDVPSPLNPPKGCRFHPRCPLAKDVCKTVVPQPITVDGHMVRCHVVEELRESTGDDVAKLSDLVADMLPGSRRLRAAQGAK
jgi:hypothetical protein